MTDIISGERFQELCDAYCGFPEDFCYNPRIQYQTSKHKNIHTITSEWDNPPIIFCYSHRLHDFSSKLDFFKNKFTLLTHNSDENITEQYQLLLDHDKIIKMYSQNIMTNHPKLHLLPIGLANSMWPHGNCNTIINIINKKKKKEKEVYFFFNIGTNVIKRMECKIALEKKGLVFGSNIDHQSYLEYLAEHKFVICPDGNGIDSHRIWESFYLGVIPILLRNDFTTQLEKLYPCVVLDSWDDFEQSIYSKYEEFSKQLEIIKNTLNFSYYASHILNDGHTFDIVIPVGPSEYNQIEKQLEYTKKNIIGYRKIFIITNTDQNTKELPGCVMINESIFPFSLKDVYRFHGETKRAGWYLQQLLKLYCGFVVPDILETYLVIDADTYFLRPVSFMYQNKILFNPGSEHHFPYFEHMKKLHPTLIRRAENLSGISHHMIFNRNDIKDLFRLVENNHSNQPFWKVFLQEVDPNHYVNSGASEYEIYFNFMIAYKSDRFFIRPLKRAEVLTNPESYQMYDLDYISCHWSRPS